MVFIPSTEVALNFSAAFSKWTTGRGLSAKLDAIDSFIQMADGRMPKTKDEKNKCIRRISEAHLKCTKLINEN